MVYLYNIFDDRICYTEKLVVTRIFQLSQRNDKLPLPQKNQGDYLVIPIFDSKITVHLSFQRYLRGRIESD